MHIGERLAHAFHEKPFRRFLPTVPIGRRHELLGLRRQHAAKEIGINSPQRAALPDIEEIRQIRRTRCCRNRADRWRIFAFRGRRRRRRRGGRCPPAAYSAGKSSFPKPGPTLRTRLPNFPTTRITGSLPRSPTPSGPLAWRKAGAGIGRSAPIGTMRCPNPPPWRLPARDRSPPRRRRRARPLGAPASRRASSLECASRIGRRDAGAPRGAEDHGQSSACAHRPAFAGFSRM